VRAWFLSRGMSEFLSVRAALPTQRPITHRSHHARPDFWRVHEADNKKNGAKAGPESFVSLVEVLEEFRLPTLPAGLRITAALDLDSLECSSHRGLRSLVLNNPLSSGVKSAQEDGDATLPSSCSVAF
jgi:hypothetical protein